MFWKSFACLLLGCSLRLLENYFLLRDVPLVPSGSGSQDGPRLADSALSQEPPGRLREEVEEQRGQKTGSGDDLQHD